MSNLLPNLLQHKFHDERTWKVLKQLLVYNTSNSDTENNQTTTSPLNLMHSRSCFLANFLLLLENILDFTIFFEDENKPHMALGQRAISFWIFEMLKVP